MSGFIFIYSLPTGIMGRKVRGLGIGEYEGNVAKGACCLHMGEVQGTAVFLSPGLE